MTSAILEEYVIKIDKHIAKQNRKILLIVDNCSSHPVLLKIKLKSVKLVIFLPKLASRLQPKVQVIKRNLKFCYRKKNFTKKSSLKRNNPQIK